MCQVVLSDDGRFVSVREHFVSIGRSAGYPGETTQSAERSARSGVGTFTRCCPPEQPIRIAGR
jgi:hypothetical protein